MCFLLEGNGRGSFRRFPLDKKASVSEAEAFCLKICQMIPSRKAQQSGFAMVKQCSGCRGGLEVSNKICRDFFASWMRTCLVRMGSRQALMQLLDCGRVLPSRDVIRTQWCHQHCVFCSCAAITAPSTETGLAIRDWRPLSRNFSSRTGCVSSPKAKTLFSIHQLLRMMHRWFQTRNRLFDEEPFQASCLAAM